jgi:hypothetical protein
MIRFVNLLYFLKRKGLINCKQFQIPSTMSKNTPSAFIYLWSLPKTSIETIQEAGQKLQIK